MPEATAEIPSVEANVLASVRRRLLRGSGWILLARVIGIPLGILINGLLARMLTRSKTRSPPPRT